MRENNPDLALLIDAVKAAGDIARHYFGRSVETKHKPDNAGPVTKADLEIDALLARDLREARPDYGWLSEETPDSDARLTKQRVFVLDPIDGTRAFIEGSKSFATAIAIVENGVPQTAAIYLPMMERLYAADRGQGATLNGAPILASKRGQMEGADVLSARPNLEPQHWRDVPAVNRHFRSSLAYRMALVAQGRFDAMLTLRPSWEWDIAAGDLIAREAGAAVTDRQGKGLRFNNPHPQVDGVLDGTPDVHRGMLQRLAPTA